MLRRLEVAAWCTGAVLIAVFLVSRLDASLSRRTGLAKFERAKLAASQPDNASGFARALSEFDSPDKTLWSPERVQGFQASLTEDFAAPLAVLRVPRIGLEVPVLEGTDEPALNRGVGHIAGTPRPGQPGNVGIAGHRDGFFRGFKDIAIGDAIDLETLAGTDRYTIESLTIVTPDRVDVLAPTSSPTLTLVTCYPFYFVGSAPQRFIVRASLHGSAAPQAAERRLHAP
jgi:sortase A